MACDGPCGGATFRHISCLGAGFWAGFFFAISGSFGLATSKRPSPGMILASMILSIVAFIFALPLIAISAIGMAGHFQYDYQGVRIIYGLQMLAGVAECIVAITTAVYLMK